MPHRSSIRLLLIKDIIVLIFALLKRFSIFAQLLLVIRKVCKKSESKNYQYPIPFSAELEGHVLGAIFRQYTRPSFGFQRVSSKFDLKSKPC